MEPVNGEASRRARGRVAMLIDNGVTGDSRVQKSARSMAEAGWDVTLIGHSSDGQATGWQLGNAEVRLLPMPTPLNKRADEFRRHWIRGPLAYPPTGVAAVRAQKARARQADLRTRGAMLTVARRSAPNGISGTRLRIAVRRRVLRVQMLAAKTSSKWVSLRYRQLTSSLRARRTLTSPWDRLYTRFWRAVLGDRSWRRLEPRLWDYELAYGRTIDDLKPDLIHAHDYRMLGVGVRAMLRARAAGYPTKLLWDAHEYVPGLNPGSNSHRFLPAMSAYEREFAPFADAVVTVSGPLAELLRAGHSLPEIPTVVLNAPVREIDEAEASSAENMPGLRELCGVEQSTPLLVYCGGIAPVRGVKIMVEALTALSDVHIALVSIPPGKPVSKHIEAVLQRADELGVRDRVHLLPYVPHWQVVPFVAAADAAVSPLVHLSNHEIALSNKFFEYAQARLPMVVSDIRTMAEVTRSLGLGEVFRAEDVDDYIRAVRAVLDDPDRYRKVYDTPGLLDGWTWEAQARALDGVYSRLVPDPYSDGQGGRRIPDVTVIVAVYNAMPYLNKCIRSLVEQTIGMEKLEIIAVDDGSTDGGGARLDALTRKYPGTFRVIHQTNSGGPAAPSNRGLEQATGRYVFFIGADDYLGPEALERMVAAADEHGADVVAGRMVGVNGRYVPKDVFTASHTDIDLFDSALPFALSNTKLFRRELIEKHGLRYPENLRVGSDQPFTLEACVRARRISVLADYDYYFAVRRRNDGNVTYRSSHEERLRCFEEVMNFTAGLIEVGPRRDAIHLRHFAIELSKLLQEDFLHLDRSAQQHICDGVGRLAEQYLTDGISARLNVSRRLRLTLARRGHLDDLIVAIRQDQGPDFPSIVVEDDGIYLGYRSFRDSRLSLPDSLFHVTDTPAESIATRFDLTGLRWTAGGDGRQVLSVTAFSPVQLSSFGVAPVVMSAGSVAGEVDLVDGLQQGGTVVTARFPLDQLLSKSRPLGDRHEVRVQLDVHGQACDVPLRMPAGVAAPKQVRRYGIRAYGVGPTKNRDGHLAVDVVPVTVSRVLGRVRRTVRNGKVGKS